MYTDQGKSNELFHVLFTWIDEVLPHEYYQLYAINLTLYSSEKIFFAPSQKNFCHHFFIFNAHKYTHSSFRQNFFCTSSLYYGFISRKSFQCLNYSTVVYFYSRNKFNDSLHFYNKKLTTVYKQKKNAYVYEFLILYESFSHNFMIVAK